MQVKVTSQKTTEEDQEERDLHKTEMMVDLKDNSRQRTAVKRVVCLFISMSRNAN